MLELELELALKLEKEKSADFAGAAVVCDMTEDDLLSEVRLSSFKSDDLLSDCLLSDALLSNLKSSAKDATSDFNDFDRSVDLLSSPKLSNCASRSACEVLAGAGVGGAGVGLAS